MARMNQKASVSKELNAKHTKILEGLLKQPENRECADCRGRAPRWASVNLGIFICMQCSGIHRSLGVHISKVRSTTLDTWLPDQIAFMQSMGNEKSNGYWEADLPTNFDRSGTEKFIRAKYEEKRWAPKGIAPPSETTINSNRLVEVEGNKIPKKTRKLSLDEEHLAEKAPVNPISLRPRAGSLDFNIKTSTSAALMSGNDASTKKAEGVQDFLNLPYPRDAERASTSRMTCLQD